MITRKIVLNHQSAECPDCGARGCKRHSVAKRRIKEIGISGPTELLVTHSRHWCVCCRKHFNANMGHLASGRKRYSHRVVRMALTALENQTLKATGKYLRERYWVHVPLTTLHEWLVESR